MPEERLQKLMAQAGIASRRAAEEMIRQGRVTINGRTAAIGEKADLSRDQVRIDGELLKPAAGGKLVYIMLNKPVGVVSAASAQRQEKRRTVRDLVSVDERVYPVGRLDADSEGLILLTNDGELTNRLTHPRYGHAKTYRVLVQGLPTDFQLELWATGVMLDDGPTSPCDITVEQHENNMTWLEIKMQEGRKRQIRRTAGAVGLRVERLVRVRIGPLRLGNLKPGEWRFLTDEEVRALKASRPGQPTPRRHPIGPSGLRRPGSRAASRPAREPGDSERPAGQTRPDKPGRARPGSPRPGGSKPGGSGRHSGEGERSGGSKPGGENRPGGSKPGGKTRPGGRSQSGGENRSGGRGRPGGSKPGGSRSGGNRSGGKKRP